MKRVKLVGGKLDGTEVLIDEEYKVGDAIPIPASGSMTTSVTYVLVSENEATASAYALKPLIPENLDDSTGQQLREALLVVSSSLSRLTDIFRVCGFPPSIDVAGWKIVPTIGILGQTRKEQGQ